MKYFTKEAMSAVYAGSGHWLKNTSPRRIKELARVTNVGEVEIAKEIGSFVGNLRRAGKGRHDSISNLPQLKNTMKSVYREEGRARDLIASGSDSGKVFKEMRPYTTAEYEGKNLKFIMNLNRPEKQLTAGKKGPRNFFMVSPQAKHYGGAGKGGTNPYGYQDSFDITDELNKAFSEVKKRG